MSDIELAVAGGIEPGCFYEALADASEAPGGFELSLLHG